MRPRDISSLIISESLGLFGCRIRASPWGRFVDDLRVPRGVWVCRIRRRGRARWLMIYESRGRLGGCAESRARVAA
ncbi:hypothetical protein H0E87_031523, partial [Populus deltoides]